jgi:hypothetical protein
LVSIKLTETGTCLNSGKCITVQSREVPVHHTLPCVAAVLTLAGVWCQV